MEIVPDVRSPFSGAITTIPFMLTAASLAALGTAYTAQYGFGMQPCELCLMQRWPYVVAIVMGVATRLMPSPRVVGALVLLMALIFLSDASLALFHVGVEQHWWSYASACTTNIPGPANASDMTELLQTVQIIPCDRPAFVLFGLSMAAYNAAFAFALSLIALSNGVAALGPTLSDHGRSLPSTRLVQGE